MTRSPPGSRRLTSLSRHLLVQVFPIAVVAMGVFHLIRGQLCDRYQVATESMEPTVHGSPVDGDVLLVDKTAYRRHPPQRFDLVVAKNPRPGDPDLVKRVAAIGPGYLRLVHGDLWFGSDSRDRLQPVVKDPVAMRDLAVTHFAFPAAGIGAGELREYFHPGAGWELAGEAITLEPAGAGLEAVAAQLTPAARAERRRTDPSEQWLPGHLSTQGDIDLTFLDCNGQRLGSRSLNADFGFEADLALAPAARGFVVTYERDERYYAVAYGMDGTGRLLENGVAAGEPFAGPPLGSGPTVRFRFGYLDGWFFFVIDDRCVLHRRFEQPSATAATEPLQPQRRTHRVHLATAGAPARVTRVRAFHDISYDYGGMPASEVLQLEEGELFLLGDNTRDSRDSRHLGKFTLADVIGRPVMVIGPLRRLRWFAR